MKIFKLVTFSIAWLAVWVAGFAIITYAVGDCLGWYLLLKNTISQCLAANTIKAFLFFIFIYFQLSIVRNALIPYIGWFDPLNFVKSCKIASQNLVTIKRDKIIYLMAINLIWVLYYAFVSIILWFSISRFMFDCDISDIVCACDNSVYIYPIIPMLLIASTLYINSIFITNLYKNE